MASSKAEFDSLTSLEDSGFHPSTDIENKKRSHNMVCGLSWVNRSGFLEGRRLYSWFLQNSATHNRTILMDKWLYKKKKMYILVFGVNFPFNTFCLCALVHVNKGFLFKKTKQKQNPLQIFLSNWSHWQLPALSQCWGPSVSSLAITTREENCALYCLQNCSN